MAVTKVSKTCEHCGTDFRTRNRPQRFCSISCAKQNLFGPPEERFWKSVIKTDTCWLWVGKKLPGGYGQMKYGGKMVLAHRFSFALHHGPIPVGSGHHGNCVLHRCDNRPCVNPTHLFVGTQTDNMADRDRKGRQGRGQKNGNAKLTEAQVMEIRMATGHRAAIGARFGISQGHVGQILRRKNWTHIPSTHGTITPETSGLQ